MGANQLQTPRGEGFSTAACVMNVRRSTYFPRTGMYWVTFRQVKNQSSGCKKHIISYEKDRYLSTTAKGT